MNAGRRLLRLIGLVGVLGLVTAALAVAGVSWGSAIEVPGIASLGVDSTVSALSCASPGNCAADGFYADASNNYQAFVVGENNGVWGSAIELPGIAALNPLGESVVVNSISCVSTGPCVAGGSYQNPQQAFITSP